MKKRKRRIKKKRLEDIKGRSPLALFMLVHCKPGHHGNKHKRDSKEACRKFDRRNYNDTNES